MNNFIKTIIGLTILFSATYAFYHAVLDNNCPCSKNYVGFKENIDYIDAIDKFKAENSREKMSQEEINIYVSVYSSEETGIDKNNWKIEYEYISYDAISSATFPLLAEQNIKFVDQKEKKNYIEWNKLFIFNKDFEKWLPLSESGRFYKDDIKQNEEESNLWDKENDWADILINMQGLSRDNGTTAIDELMDLIDEK